ncbi:MAG: tetratricopeptide repeat protein [Bacteroidota bacterium]
MEFEEFDIEFLAQKLAENPQSPLFARLADLYVGKEQAAEAMKLLNEGLKSYPGYYAGYIVLGKAHLALKEYTRAQAAFEKALELSPFNQTAAQLLISVPNKPDESTRTTDENYFAPAQTDTYSAGQQSYSQDPVQENSLHNPFETAAVEELGLTAQPEGLSGSSVEQPYIHESLFETVTDDVSTAGNAFPSYDDYYTQNQSRINTQSPESLDDYLRGDLTAQESVTSEENNAHTFVNDSAEVAESVTGMDIHIEPEPVFASPEQAQLFAELNAMNEESASVDSQSSTNIDALAEKLQSAEKIIPQENYHPQHPVPPEVPEEEAYETDAVTETLAEIYASQGEYKAAIQAYEILMFSQPVKGGEYLQRIRELQQKQMEKDGLV